VYLVKFFELYDREHILIKTRAYTDDNLAASAKAKWCRKSGKVASVEKIQMGE
jgi:hypothetical protein